MTDRLFIQADRCGEWRTISTIPFDGTLKRSKNEEEICRDDAMAQAVRSRRAWQDYHLFQDCRLRIAEPNKRGKLVEVAA